MNKAQEIQNIHRLYCQLTRMEVSLEFGRERAWFEFLRRFNQEDLRLVISRIQKGISKGERNLGALRFRNLIESIDYFEEELAMARAEARVKKPAPREVAIRDLRPQVAQTIHSAITAQPIAHYIEALRRAAS